MSWIYRSDCHGERCVMGTILRELRTGHTVGQSIRTELIQRLLPLLRRYSGLYSFHVQWNSKWRWIGNLLLQKRGNGRLPCERYLPCRSYTGSQLCACHYYNGMLFRNPFVVSPNFVDRADFTIRDRKSTRLNSSHSGESRMPSSA